MNQYLKLFLNEEEYNDYCEKPVCSHLIKEVILIFDNNYNPCQDDGCPPEGCCDLDGGYYN